MRIAILVSGPWLANGVCRVAESWAHILAAGGHQPLLVCEGREPLPEIPGGRAVAHREAPLDNRLTRRRALRREAMRSVAGLMEEAPIDLLLSHDWSLSIGARRAFPAVPLAQTIHSPLVDETRLNNWKYATQIWRKLSHPLTLPLLWRTEREALRSIDAAHTLSRFTWSLLRGRHASVCDATPWQRIPGSFDERRFVPAADRREVRSRLGLPEDARILLTIRRLVPRTGVDRVLAAARRVCQLDPKLRFVIGGTGALEARLRGEIDAGLADQVELRGFIPEEELPAYYQAADAFLMPTRDLECFGLPVVEAMACGASCLVMPEGGPQEIVVDERCVARANSTEAFVELVERFVRGEIPGDRDRLAAAARDTYAESAVRGPVLEFVSETAERFRRR